jgi:hypothetical protein
MLEGGSIVACDEVITWGKGNTGCVELEYGEVKKSLIRLGEFYDV